MEYINHFLWNSHVVKQHCCSGDKKYDNWRGITRNNPKTIPQDFIDFHTAKMICAKRFCVILISLWTVFWSAHFFLFLVLLKKKKALLTLLFLNRFQKSSLTTKKISTYLISFIIWQEKRDDKSTYEPCPTPEKFPGLDKHLLSQPGVGAVAYHHGKKVQLNPALRRRNFLALICNCYSNCCPSLEWEVTFFLLSSI